MPDVLPAEAALPVGDVAGAGGAVPGAVGVPRQAALGARLPVRLAAVQPQHGHAHRGAHIQRLLWKRSPSETKVGLL